ncbi:hypothetical protein [Marinobacter halophilus]|uniref:Uncharacterized protein n=1 Tax=Marinobacter halophilus TaxID=1323740 RepID=A0A2T1K8H6_9GAMM|nr:hypothetical protein [Marinobacter halophilus]PSF06328.1 hypothetical protein C7H08_14505 [Marinobacter halophilus]GGC71622.1 hypothetical protein GCM10011362_20180 [Marinobacter halophilus]
MITFLTLTSLFLLLLSSLLLWQLFEQRKMICQMLENEGIGDTHQDPELVLTLRVLNPIALAKRHSRTGRILADRLPIMTRKMVYQEVMKELETELLERDIDVNMHIEYR